MSVGIDEVGRGSLAGPLVAGAVALACPIDGLRDSKLLPRLERERLAALIHATAHSVGLGWVTAAEVDELGLTNAVRLAMRRALLEIKHVVDEIIIDGNYNFLADMPQARAIIKADQTVAAVSAASIVAKVARDAWMAAEAATRYPAYGFERHVGYCTPAHLAALQAHGPCAIHRRSFEPIRTQFAGQVSELV